MLRASRCSKGRNVPFGPSVVWNIVCMPSALLALREPYEQTPQFICKPEPGDLISPPPAKLTTLIPPAICGNKMDCDNNKRQASKARIRQHKDVWEVGKKGI